MGSLTVETVFGKSNSTSAKNKWNNGEVVPLSPSSSGDKHKLIFLLLPPAPQKQVAVLWFPCPVVLAGLKRELVIYSLPNIYKWCTESPARLVLMKLIGDLIFSPPPARSRWYYHSLSHPGESQWHPAVKRLSISSWKSQDSEVVLGFTVLSLCWWSTLGSRASMSTH